MVYEKLGVWEIFGSYRNTIFYTNVDVFPTLIPLVKNGSFYF